MTERDEREDLTPSTFAQLSCGHRVRLPWGISPEVALADLLRHESDCRVEPEMTFHGAFRWSLEPMPSTTEGAP